MVYFTSKRPYLVPENRKIRHLQGIYVRNLQWERPIGADADTDEAEAKDVTLDDDQEEGDAHDEDENNDNTAPSDPISHRQKALSPVPQSEPPSPRHDPQPADQKQRRRMSINPGSWASPKERQLHLEKVLRTRLGDAFFTLHCDGEEEPIYISETLRQATNFNFRFFDLPSDGWFMRSPIVIVRLWARRLTSWEFVLEDTMDLRRLHPLDTLVEHQFSPNSLIVHLVDGMYTVDVTRTKELFTPPRQVPPRPTASYHTLMRICTLEASMYDAMQTRNEVSRAIEERMKNREADDAQIQKVAKLKDQIALAESYIALENKALHAVASRRDALKTSMEVTRRTLASRTNINARGWEAIDTKRKKIEEVQEDLAQVEVDVRGQRRRIITEISDIFRIQPVPHAPPLHFSICGIPLPNADYDDDPTVDTIFALSSMVVEDGAKQGDMISAGLGYAAMLTNHLHYYLSYPLPYPIIELGSRSMMGDEISMFAGDDPADASSPSWSHSSASASAASGSSPLPQVLARLHGRGSSRARVFPLHLPRGGVSTSAQFRFDYAWFLLNKDIEALCASQQLRIMDIRQTLGNLKYLLYLGSSGTAALPARKAGGIRMMNTPSARPSSQPGNDADFRQRMAVMAERSSLSEVALASSAPTTRDSPLSQAPQRALPRGKTETDRADATLLGFSTLGPVSLRTKGMRERAG